MSRPVANILAAYLAAGGAKMDEPSYQRYKLALLLDWLEREKVFEVIHWQDLTGAWKNNKIPKPDHYVCKSAPGCEFTTEEIEGAVDHLVAHFPMYFEGRKARTATLTKEQANGTSK